MTLTPRGIMAKEATEQKQPKEKRPQANKRDLQSEKRRLRNRVYKSSVKTAVRQFETLLSNGDASSCKESLNQVYSLMDKGVQKGVFKLNKASRTKARLTARLLAKA
jgi:small subunit ribosomal protein S20